MTRSRARRPRRAAGLVAAAALLATAACGSTVQTRDQLVAGGGAPGGGEAGGLAADGTGDGLGDPSLGGDGLGDPSLGGDGLGGPGAVGGGAPGAPGAAPQGGGAPVAGGAPGAPGAPGGGAPAAPAPGSPGAQGIGVTDKEIFIGVSKTANGEAANAAIGAAISRGDEEANVKAVIDEVNARGGVAGRKLVPVFHTYDAQSRNTAEGQDQAACATFTQDNKVFAAGSGLTDNLSACLQKAGVLQVNSGQLIDKDREFFGKFPNYFDIGTLSQDRMMAEQVATLGRLDYFSAWDPALGRPGQGAAKLGVLSFDDPNWNRPLDRVFLPALAKAGHRVDAGLVARVFKPENQSDVARTSADVQNAVLRFRQSGVTHVLLLDASGVLGIAYSGAAKNQRYLPRLGVNTATGMQALFDVGVFDNAQLAGAAGLGWFPSIDLPAGQGERFLGPAAKQCLDIIKKRTGQSFSSTNAASLALAACDSIFLTAAAINGAGKTVNLGTARAALEGLGGKFPPALIPASFFSKDRHDGLQRGFDMVWNTQCSCAQYRDGGHDIP